jgi:hypothetical protein
MDFFFWSFLGWVLKVIQPVWNTFEGFFNWSANSWLGRTVADSVWKFPAIETVHILAMAIMFGGLLVLNLRLMGLGMTRQPLPLLSKTLMPFVNWGLILMLISGYAMFASEAQKCFVNDGFKIKMVSLFLILIFQYTFYRSLLKKDDAERNRIIGGGAALLNFALWFMVGAGGRAIGFV